LQIEIIPMFIFTTRQHTSYMLSTRYML